MRKCRLISGWKASWAGRCFAGGLSLLLAAPALAQEPVPPGMPPTRTLTADDIQTEPSRVYHPPAHLVAEAEEEEEFGTLLVDHFTDDCGDNWLLDNGFNLYGWVEAGVMFNPQRPGKGPFNGSNLPGPGFADRANSPMLNQIYVIFERDAGFDEDEFGLGFRMDFLAGNDAKFTQATGWDDSWGTGANSSAYFQYAMPQLYAELYAPVGNGLRVKAGHFYTIIGYEVVPARDNFFYTHAYTMQYGEPFTHTGALATYSLNDNIDISAGFHNGWDDFVDDDAHPWGFLGGISWTDDDEILSIAYAVSWSQESVDMQNDLTGVPGGPGIGEITGVEGDRYVQSIVVQAQLTEQLSYVIQSDYGIQSNGVFALNPGVELQDAEWYGINQYLFYQLTDSVAAGLRYEWFRDDDGARVRPNGGAAFGSGNLQSLNGNPPVLTGGNYHAITAGLNWKLNQFVLIRPEVRWDWSDVGRPIDRNLPLTFDGVYNDFKSDRQFTVGGDVIISF